MDVREKLVELLNKANSACVGTDCCEDCKFYAENDCLYKLMADVMITNGVTVQEMKPLEAFLHPIDAYEGLKAKYLVFKADTGERVGNCFILRPDKDAAAVEALRAYAKSTDNKILARDIYDWVGKGVTVQEWISVKDRLPEVGCNVLFVCENGNYCVGAYSDTYRDFFSGQFPVKGVTHWQYLPQPPKGE